MVISPDTNITGIFQSDLILQSAIVEALKRIRDNPGEIDYIFQSLLKDKLTRNEYGSAQIESFKHWFLNSDIPVSPSFRVDQTVFPIITFSLQSSDEVEQTLGDIHYQPQEDTGADWPVLAGPFDPVNYFPSSGLMQLPFPDDVLRKINIMPGMYLLDVNNNKHIIIDILDSDLIMIAPGTTANFHNVLLVGGVPKLTTSIESVFMKEVYSIGVHVQGEAFYLIALHSVLIYALQKYKEVLLEAREFERSIISNTEFRRNNEFGNEVVFSRWINIVGYTKHIWAKNVRPKIEQVISQPIISIAENGIIISGIDDDLNNPPVDEEGLPAQPDDPFTVRPQ